MEAEKDLLDVLARLEPLGPEDALPDVDAGLAPAAEYNLEEPEPRQEGN